VDKLSQPKIGALFANAADTTAELGGSGVYVGKARIAEFYDRVIGGEGLEPGELFNHIILQGVVHVADDGQTAKGRWRALIQIGQQGESAIWAEGPYENEYVNEDGVWKFNKVHWYQTFTAPYDQAGTAPLPMDPPLADFRRTAAVGDLSVLPVRVSAAYHYGIRVGPLRAGVCDDDQ
jgi:hypothetical protein